MRSILTFLMAALTLVACSGGTDYSLKSSVIRGVNYVGLSVSDIDETVAFYKEPAALDVMSVPSGSDKIERSVMLRSVNGQLHLTKYKNPGEVQVTPVQGPGIAHVCFQVAKETNTYGKFLGNGGGIIGHPEPVQLSKRNPVEYAYLTDPDGNVIEVEHVDIEALDLPAPPPNTHRIRHVALATPDLNHAVKFYSALLDEPKPRRIGRLMPFSGENIDKVSGLSGSKIKMAWFQIRNMELELSQYFSHPTDLSSSPRPANAIGYNMIVFDVTDLQQARAKFLDAGGSLEPESLGYDPETIFFGRDPDGNLLGFQSVPDNSVYSSQNFDGNGT